MAALAAVVCMAASADVGAALPAAAVGKELSRTMLPVRDWLVWGETYKAVLAADRAVDDAWRACRRHVFTGAGSTGIEPRALWARRP